MGGDVSGVASAATVAGIQGAGVTGAPVTSADTLKFNAITGNLEWHAQIRYASSGVNAAANAPYLLNEIVVIYPGSPTSEAGTYQITSNDGSTFPGDYTKVSDHTDVAAEVAIVDAGGYYESVEVEGALQEIASGSFATLSGDLPVGLTVMDSAIADDFTAIEWAIVVYNAGLRFTCSVRVAHDGANASLSEYASAAGPGVGVLPITFDADISTGVLRLLATASAAGWKYHARRMVAFRAPVIPAT